MNAMVSSKAAGIDRPIAKQQTATSKDPPRNQTSSTLRLLEIMRCGDGKNFQAVGTTGLRDPAEPQVDSGRTGR